MSIDLCAPSHYFNPYFPAGKSVGVHSFLTVNAGGIEYLIPTRYMYMYMYQSSRVCMEMVVVEVKGQEYARLMGWGSHSA